MTDLASEYGIPPELMPFIDSGFLVLLSETPAEKTVEFHIPSLQYEDENETVTAFSLIWIHPDYNAQFCHFYHETPSDLPNFYLSRERSESASDNIDLDSVDDLIDWLESQQARRLRS